MHHVKVSCFCDPGRYYTFESMPRTEEQTDSKNFIDVEENEWNCKNNKQVSG